MRLPAVVVAGVLAATVVAAIVTVRRHRSPRGGVLHIVLGDTQLRAMAAVGAGVYGGMFAALYAVPHVLYRQHQYSTIEVGMVLLPGAAGAVVLARIASRYVPSLGAVRVLTIVAVMFGDSWPAPRSCRIPRSWSLPSRSRSVRSAPPRPSTPGSSADAHRGSAEVRSGSGTLPSSAAVRLARPSARHYGNHSVSPMRSP
ncbi:hypothetical protein [Catenuloplanes atrovinosus]|uniref:Uncharacterized protein n=1 Tax=Catenuloplanes atrovinosus TaxID=137266 RepID=A0AAE4CAM9_9ACTN|nr:hypothetical protein [Catenuloplanes atrovinosus]MDR7277751.1 hypothetical protein [Catenuloplanes atrovinosus]